VIIESIVSCELGVSRDVFTKVQVQRMTDGGYCVPGNADGRSHCQNNFGNTVPRRSRWKRPLT